ncbi:MAG: hypothetical protein COA97_00250 [Flavobacteriales bacterium]|nr:MAG: hypothetical protein COA97_00250 [Flavobacteriales bacterium]
MKKVYYLAVAVTLSTMAFSQKVAKQASYSFSFDKAQHPNSKTTNDTIYSHFTGSPEGYRSGVSGWIAGHNDYNDIGKMQLMDSAHGLNTTNGAITDVLFWFAGVEGNPNSTFEATIWADNAGIPGTVLGSVSVPYSAVDTVATNLMSNGIIGWNAVATFTSPIGIPSNQKFWVGITFTPATGDTIGLVHTTDTTAQDTPGTTGDFADAITNTFEQWDDNSYHSFNDGTTNSWGLDIAIAVFPVLSLNGVGIEELNDLDFNVYPNPSTGDFNINLNSTIASAINLSVRNIVGQTIISKTVAVSGRSVETISLTDYSKGIYFLTVNNKTVKLIVE